MVYNVFHRSYNQKNHAKIQLYLHICKKGSNFVAKLFSIMLFESQIIDITRHLSFTRVAKEKAEIRGLDSQRRRVMSKEEVKEGSHKIAEQIERMTCWKEAKTVMLY